LLPKTLNNKISKVNMNKLYLLSYGSFYNYKYPNEQTNTMNGGKLRPVDFNKTVDRDSLRLQWVSYQLGKRESRRLVGDYLYTFNDVRNTTQFEDSVVFETRAVDVALPGKSIAQHHVRFSVGSHVLQYQKI